MWFRERQREAHPRSGYRKESSSGIYLLVTEIIIGNPGYLQSTLILFQARTRNLLTVQEQLIKD